MDLIFSLKSDNYFGSEFSSELQIERLEELDEKGRFVYRCEYFISKRESSQPRTLKFDISSYSENLEVLNFLAYRQILRKQRVRAR